jgi:phosphoribosylamine-glycine ligase
VSETSDKTILFFDSGGDYVHVAEAVVPEYKQVLLYVPWESSFSTSKGLLAGIGLDGIEKVSDFFEHLDRADVVVFTDVGNYGLQEWLRARGMPVFGCGAGGKLETDRWKLKEACQQLDILAADASPIHGVEALAQILKKYDDLWIKLSYMRGETETRHHKNWMETEDWLHDLSVRMGPYKSLAQFVIETPIADDDGPCVEIGFDTFCSDGVFPDEILYGYEEKDSAYVGCVGRIPDRLAATRDSLAKLLSELSYRGALSTETREVETGSYLVDLTCRFPSPPSELMSKMISNLGEVIRQVANGEKPTPEYRFKYGAQIVLRSDWFQEHPLAIKVNRPNRTAIHGHCIVNGQEYAVSVSEIAEMGGAIGMGDSMEDAIAEAYEIAESVEGADVKYDSGALNKTLESVKDGLKLDIIWGDEVHG